MTINLGSKTVSISSAGVQGLSAYQAAVKNGFSGTEQNWLDSLIAVGGSGDMTKSVYDTNLNGIVDNAEKVNNKTVNSNVPLNAVFTDTVYDDTAIKAEVAVNTAKVGITTQQAKDITANNAKVSNVGHPLVETAVPLNAVFTDTIYNDTNIQSKANANTTKLAGIENNATADQTPSEIKTAYESNLNTNVLTDTLLTLLNLKKVKDITTDAVNNWLVITYTDNTSANLTISDIVADIHVSGASLNASTNVLTLSSTNGGANVTVDLSDFINSSELTSALSTKQDVLLEGAFVNGDKTKLNNIPSNADNTATNETSHANVLVDSDTVSPVTPSNKLLTQSDAVAGGQVNSVVAGTNVTVDNTDPTNPVVSSSGGGGGTSFWTPKVKSGRWSDFRDGGQYVGGGAFNTGYIQLSPFNIYQAHTITDFSVKITSTTALSFTFCIYSADINNPLSITLEHSEEVTTTTSAGAYSVTLLTPLVLDPTKLYWKGITVSNSNYRGDYLSTSRGATTVGWFLGSAGGDWAMTQCGMTIPHTYGNAIPATATIGNTSESGNAINFSMKVQ